MKRVMVFGTFDILHPGHIQFLRQARKHGDFLMVSLAREENVRRIKGRAPRHTEAERKQMLRAVTFVDRVVIGAARDYISHILKEKPNIIVLGYDQKEYTKGLRKKLKERGLDVQIARVRPYKKQLYQSSLLLDSRLPQAGGNEKL